MLLPGSIDDGGFIEAGFHGLLAIEADFGADVRYVEALDTDFDALVTALQTLAADKPDLVIAHGEITADAALAVAATHPDIRFAVIDAGTTGPNLSSYCLREDQTAWLAGAAAGLLTHSGIVGHLSGQRDAASLANRGAFYNGLRHTNQLARFESTFIADTDDQRSAYRASKSMIVAGADIIFAALGTGRVGASRAMREHGVRQIGNVIDWTALQPDLFLASAVLHISMAVVEAARDVVKGRWLPERIVRLGLERPRAVDLAINRSVDESTRTEIAALRRAIINGEIAVSATYPKEELSVR